MTQRYFPMRIGYLIGNQRHKKQDRNRFQIFDRENKFCRFYGFSKKIRSLRESLIFRFLKKNEIVRGLFTLISNQKQT